MNKSLLIIISGPSGVGKSSIAQALLNNLQTTFPLQKVTTYTTRLKRTNEQEGIDYHFISKETFQKQILQNFFFEYTSYNNEYYGTPKSFVKTLEKGTSCLIVTDYTVGNHIKKSFPNTLLFWLIPPSLTILQERLQKRNTESPERIRKRLEIAHKELLLEEQKQNFTFHIVNEHFENTVETLREIILQKIACNN